MRLKNEAMVGLVVILGIITAVAGAVWLSGRKWGGADRVVTASFSNVGALTVGNPVKYRGVNIGRVAKIDLAPRGTGVYVDLEITQDITMPNEPGVLLSSESMFGGWQAVIVSQPDFPDLAFTTAPRRDVLPGASLPDITELTAVAARIASDIELLSERIQIAFTPETAVKIRETIENVEGATEQLSGFMGAQMETYGKVGTNVLATTENIRLASVEARQTMAAVRGSMQGGDVQAIMANARRASENFAALSTELQGAASGVPGLVTSANTTLSTFGQTATTFNEMLAGLQPGLAQVGPTMAEARAAMASFNTLLTSLQSQEGSLGRLLTDPALFEETQRLIVTMQRLMADIQANPGKYVGELQVF
jgi:phospholipid/cholesterol/gamma-HCH transport system substrate-binding protein